MTEKGLTVAKETELESITKDITAYLGKQAGKMSTASTIADNIGHDKTKTYNALDLMRRLDLVVKAKDLWILKPTLKSKYLNWDGNLDKMRQLYDMGINVLTIGNKGTGKTECVQQLALEKGKRLYTVNLSLRCRESHILGRLDVEKDNGVQKIVWKKGPLPLSMLGGDVLYLDELSAGEPDVLLRLNECLDSRRQLNYEGEEIVAADSWFCVASINPLTTPGTKELPPQLISRFTARLVFNYPDVPTELDIVKAHVNLRDDRVRDTMLQVIKFFNQMRRTQELAYTPSIRESILVGRLLQAGWKLGDALDVVAFNPLKHWDEDADKAARELAVSLGLMTV